MKFIKDKSRYVMTDEHLDQLMRIAISPKEPNFDKLIKIPKNAESTALLSLNTIRKIIIYDYCIFYNQLVSFFNKLPHGT